MSSVFPTLLYPQYTIKQECEPFHVEAHNAKDYREREEVDSSRNDLNFASPHIVGREVLLVEVHNIEILRRHDGKWALHNT